MHGLSMPAFTNMRHRAHDADVEAFELRMRAGGLHRVEELLHLGDRVVEHHRRPGPAAVGAQLQVVEAAGVAGGDLGPDARDAGERPARCPCRCTPVVRLMITPGQAARIASQTSAATSGSHDGRCPCPSSWRRMCTCMMDAPALNASRASAAICAAVTGTGCCAGSVEHAGERAGEDRFVHVVFLGIELEFDQHRARAPPCRAPRRARAPTTPSPAALSHISIFIASTQPAAGPRPRAGRPRPPPARRRPPPARARRAPRRPRRAAGRRRLREDVHGGVARDVHALAVVDDQPLAAHAVDRRPRASPSPSHGCSTDVQRALRPRARRARSTASVRVTPAHASATRRATRTLAAIGPLRAARRPAPACAAPRRSPSPRPRAAARR